MAKLAIANTNRAIVELLEITENPRHRFMLQAYYRHRYLEIAGRYEEIFAPDMMVEDPVYHFHALGISTRLEGQDAIKNLYRTWSETGECVMYTDDEEVAVSDHMIASKLTGYQFKPGHILAAAGIDVDDHDAMYIYKASEEMVWPYDDRCRLVGEDVWEVDPDRAEIIKLDPADVITPQEARQILDPFIRPLPAFDETAMRPARPQRSRIVAG
ncbi:MULTISPECIES: hypothetical protein [Streptomyces]|uniref:hypothetical protein n=1 Tax=Streptomyces TaxID=1883 RepID=UPI00073DEA83|nr:hypothetical protein [Streptomyces sp. EAS-AB2608]BCM67847.1 hypothetical protein EASAB2608_03181 [Streptomyces sp. EAS-AB2608]CUW29328.1 hypothetical protein TUE45_04055 [Streptomyces reticuli]